MLEESSLSSQSKLPVPLAVRNPVIRNLSARASEIVRREKQNEDENPMVRLIAIPSIPSIHIYILFEM